MHCASLEAISDYIGPAATARLIECAGGEMLKVPKRKSGKTWDMLKNAMGEEPAGVMCAHFGGEALYIAVNHAAAVRKRCEEVRARVSKGERFADIARTMHVTMRFTERGIRRMAQVESPKQKNQGLPQPHQLMMLFG